MQSRKSYVPLANQLPSINIYFVSQVDVSIPYAYRADGVHLCVFLFLVTLPNLSTIAFDRFTAMIRLQDLNLFTSIAQKTALRHISFSLKDRSVASGPRIAGPEGLESISIYWKVVDDPDSPGSSMVHLYEFLRPSLGTLTRLKLEE